MMFTRTSPLTGREHTMELDVSMNQLSLWLSGELIQNAMRHLNEDEREFLINGYTPTDSKAMLKSTVTNLDRRFI